MKTFLDDWMVGETAFQRERKRLRAKMEREKRVSAQAIQREKARQMPAVTVAERPVTMKKSTNWLKAMEWK